MMCQCRISYGPNAGKQCTYKAQADSKFCGVHRHCDEANVLRKEQERSDLSQTRVGRPPGTSRTGRLKRDNFAIRNKMNSNMPSIKVKELTVKASTGKQRIFKNRHTMSILIWDLMYNNGARIIEILNRYPDLINEESNFGTTPLIAAIYRGNIDATRILISRGADFRKGGRIYDVGGCTPLGLAAIVGHLNIYHYLSGLATEEDIRQAFMFYITADGRSMMSWDTILSSIPRDTPFSDREVLNMLVNLSTDKWLPYVEIIGNRFPHIFRRGILGSIYNPKVKALLESFGAT
jgi:hypothetical protein